MKFSVKNSISAPKAAYVKGPGDRYVFGDAIPFAIAHLVCFAAIWTGVHLTDVLIAVGLYGARMFGITAGFHRYFSHRSYKTSRVFGFMLAFLGQTSAQSSVLWWAGTHRHHHRHSDEENDVHSPVRRGFWFSHLGWIFTARYQKTDLEAIPDFAKYPELMWLDRHPFLPAIILAVLVFLCAGWSGLVVGFFWSTVATWHGVFSINSLAHVWGRKRYLTGDQSRNNWWLALLTLGEGWHNNHHHYQSAACQGFRWYEIDITYYILKAFSWVGLVWELRTPPRSVVYNEQKLGRVIVERAATELAASFQIEKIATDLSASIDTMHGNLTEQIDLWRQQFDETMDLARYEFDEFVQSTHLPAMPSAADLRDRAAEMFVRTPSFNDMIERAQQIIIDNVFQEVLSRQLVVITPTRDNGSH